MLTQNLGYPRIGSQRELKKACEKYWTGRISYEQLIETGKSIRLQNWQLQKNAGIDLIPSNDFSFYDQILDMSLSVGCIPDRYKKMIFNDSFSEMDLYFAMARGFQQDGIDITAMEMTKWFDTNYHYIVPEFVKDQDFSFFSSKIIDEYKEALKAGIKTKPVLIGAVSYLLLGKEKDKGFHKIDLINRLLPVYFNIIQELETLGVEYIQIDEPYLALDLDQKVKDVLLQTYNEIHLQFPKIKIILTNYFDCFGDNLETVLSLPVHALHLDLARCPSQLEDILSSNNLPSDIHLSLGVVDGRNIWKNNFQNSLSLIQRTKDLIGKDRILIASSCSLLHSPCDLELETNEKSLTAEIKQWLAFSKQKIAEIVTLKELSCQENLEKTSPKLQENILSHKNRKASSLIHKEEVKARVHQLKDTNVCRENPFSIRKEKQKSALNLPLFPTTTIGSFPQTKEVRKWRLKLKKGELSQKQYDDLIKKETVNTIRFQEEIGLDVLVHGEFERNDMVEYFGEQLQGFVFTANGWVQSYGSRCVKPPIIYGDINRSESMTVKWSSFAQSLTQKLVKGMLTGPVTILQWSFVRDDQPRAETCTQIALAIREEVKDLEKAGLKIIQIDEPAIREGLPLRKANWATYLDWSIRAFKIASSGVKDETQIHTHMCYSEFNDIIQNIANMDADVITIECSKSQMELLDAFSDFKYPNEIGPGVYDIHSPRVPSGLEMIQLLEKANSLIPTEQLWVNPDCGLKTRHWKETKLALNEMVAAAREMRLSIKKTIDS